MPTIPDHKARTPYRPILSSSLSVAASSSSGPSSGALRTGTAAAGRGVASSGRSEPGSAPAAPTAEKRPSAQSAAGSAAGAGSGGAKTSTPSASLSDFEQQILAEILVHRPSPPSAVSPAADASPRSSVSLDDIAGLEDAKRILHEACILPSLLPHLFGSAVAARATWKGILLFGPPGTGKTLLARAVASQTHSAFFSISSATVLSKYYGESEKVVKAVFALARRPEHSPCVIFFDEVDALMSRRGDANEHEASRRVKSALLQEMDGLVSGQAKERILVLATTNKPWDLDEAIRRRLEKRVYVRLPATLQELTNLFRLHLRSVKHCIPDEELAHILAEHACLPEQESAEGDATGQTAASMYSGADIHCICAEAAMAPLRLLLAGLSPAEIAQRQFAEKDVPPVTAADLLASIRSTPATVARAELRQFELWNQQFGSCK